MKHSTQKFTLALGLLLLGSSAFANSNPELKCKVEAYRKDDTKFESSFNLATSEISSEKIIKMDDGKTTLVVTYTETIPQACERMEYGPKCFSLSVNVGRYLTIRNYGYIEEGHAAQGFFMGGLPANLSLQAAPLNQDAYRFVAVSCTPAL